MSWKEFSILLNGLGADTPLVKVVSIRSEDDPKVVREMTKEQKQIRNAWRRRQFEKKPPKDQEEMMANLQNAIKGMIGI